MTSRNDITKSATFLEAARLAREDRRRYWAKGGAADRKYSVHDDVKRWWLIDVEGDVELADLRRARQERAR